MTLYLGIIYHPDMSNRKRIEDILGALQADGHKTFCMVRDLELWGEESFSPKDLMDATCRMIESCDWVLLEVSEKGLGLGIEASFSKAKGIPILAIATPDSGFSPTLQGIAQTLHYQASSDTVAFFRGVHHAHVSA